MADLTTQRGVLVGVDGSPASKVAVDWAARDAALRRVPLTLIHVLLPAVVMTLPEVPMPQEFLRWQEEQGRKIISDSITVAEDATRAHPIQIDSAMVTGSPIGSIAHLSKDAELVVVGCRGHSRLGTILGSVSFGLVQHAQCPVAVIHDEDPLMQDFTHAPVVVGIDGSPASETATAIAFDEASRRGVHLVALHACMNWVGLDFPAVDWSTAETRGQEVLAERLAGWQEKYPEVTIRRVVVADRAAQHLLAESERAQLVVVGSHGWGGFAGTLLGSVSSAVVQSARMPVIVARES